MTVESRDDLTSALADWDKYDPDASSGKIIRQAHAVVDAARGAAKRVAELEAERNDIRLHFDQAMKEFDVRNEEIASLQRALAEERERCARVADAIVVKEQQIFREAEADKALSDSGRAAILSRALARENAAMSIAIAIRSGKPDGKE